MWYSMGSRSVVASSTSRLITIASSGHASSHRPQNMQRDMSMSKTAGMRSIRSVVSAGRIVMQSVGQANSHSPQATHFGFPLSSCTSTGWPRNASA